jgi:hypothetical protein
MLGDIPVDPHLEYMYYGTLPSQVMERSQLCAGVTWTLLLPPQLPEPVSLDLKLTQESSGLNLSSLPRDLSPLPGLHATELTGQGNAKHGGKKKLSFSTKKGAGVRSSLYSLNVRRQAHSLSQVVSSYSPRL